jgi:ribonuclease BN (tRNA processing enzyme)
MGLSRRRFIAAAATGAAAALLPGAARPQVPAWAQGTKLVLLGTMAGPVLAPNRQMASQAVFVDGAGYLVDCGYGTVERMTRLGIRPPMIGAVFITHHHSDHNADYANLVHLAWIQGLQAPIRVYGPPPMKAINAAALALHEEDVSIRVRATGREPMAKLIQVQEITRTGVVHQDDRVKVTAAIVDHPPLAHAFGFRIDSRDRSIVISGDTRPTQSLVELARGADMLVHEAMHVPSIDRMLAKRPYVPPRLKQFLTEGHTSAEDCGRIAAAAGVKTLVLSHLLPGDDTEFTDEMWRAEAAKHFSGEIIVGSDLMVI